MRRSLILAAIFALTLLGVGAVDPGARLGAQVGTPSASPQPGSAESRLYEAILPEQRADVIAATAGRLPVYTIEAILTLAPPTDKVPAASAASSPEATSPVAAPATGEEAPAAPAATVTGRLALHYVNDTRADLPELFFRLYPNDERYAEGGIELRDVRVDGAAITPELSVGDTVARLPLSTSLAPGGTVTVALDFTTAVPNFTPPSSQFSFESESGTISLAHWYPVLAGYDPDAGWVLDPVSLYGDIVFSNTALYDVALTAPGDLDLVATGVEVDEKDVGGEVRRQFVSGPAREFTVIADADFESVSRDVGGTTVTSYYNPERAAGGQRILDQATQALAIFNGLFGSYPYAQLDVIELPLGDFGGIEYPQLIGINAPLYEDPAALAELGYPPASDEFTVAHEVGHQWWYGLVGNNHYAHAFVDEGLTQYSTIVYFERQHGPAAAELQLNLERTALLFRFVTRGDLLVDQPTDAFPGPGSYSDTVYDKASLGFRALRLEIGDEAFFAALRDYATRHRFGVAAPADLRATFERAAGRDLAAFWHAWFESTQTRVEAVIETGPATPSAS